MDSNELCILKIEENSVVFMEVHGELKAYKPIKNIDDSWDMDRVEGTDGNSGLGDYGLSCQNIKELRALLLADYATGIITKTYF